MRRTIARLAILIPLALGVGRILARSRGQAPVPTLDAPPTTAGSKDEPRLWRELLRSPVIANALWIVAAVVLGQALSGWPSGPTSAPPVAPPATAPPTTNPTAPPTTDPPAPPTTNPTRATCR